MSDFQRATVRVGYAGLNGTGVTSGEKTGIFNRLTDLEGATLDAHADAAGIAAAADGKIIVRSGGQWVLQDLPGTAAWGSISGTLADQTDLQTALNAKAATTHTHNPRLKDVVQASNLSNISSGTTTLCTTTVTLVSGITYDIDATGYLEGYGNSGTNALGKLRVTINGNSKTSPVDLTYEQGVDAPKVQVHTQSVSGTGAAITISFEFIWTSGTLKPWHAQLVYSADPRG